MLLPAVNAARETGRRTQCKNNLHQIAAAFLAHESAHGFLPTGGWSHEWMGDPDRGFTNKQPGGWCYNILPHIEQNNLWQLSINSPSSSAKIAQEQILWATPVSLYNCPTRRRLCTGPNAGANTFLPTNVSPTQLFRGDYAANLGGWGDNGGYQSTNWPPDYPTADGMTDAQWDAAYNDSVFDGICFKHSEVTMADITDGASCTYMVCEKYLDPEHYYDGLSQGDDQGAYCGFDRDTSREAGSNTTWEPPMLDRFGQDLTTCFGSAHLDGWNASFCDGSVHSMSYSIDMITHQNLASRNDGNAIDTSKFDQ